MGWEPLIASLAAGDPCASVCRRSSRDVTASLHHTLAERLGTTDDGLQRVHGDLHVGQFLRSGETLVVVDWEGRPSLTLEERRRPRPALHDLASLRLSLAHAARAAHRRNPGFDWRAWSVAARDEALGAYGAPSTASSCTRSRSRRSWPSSSTRGSGSPSGSTCRQDVLPFVLEERP